MKRPTLILLSVYACFFISGLCALTYQIAWQRLLFAGVGVDIESVTIIVSAFMLGLGVGAVGGGVLADRFPTRILLIFAVVEFGIAGFGLLSPFAIAAVSGALSDHSRALMAVTQFALFLIPTSCMGATLPALVRWVQERLKNIGASIGQLYFVNTLGAATGAMLCGFVLFSVLTLHTAIYLAALLNGLIGLIALWLDRQSAHQQAQLNQGAAHAN